jgi:hypothetical protein
MIKNIYIKTIGNLKIEKTMKSSVGMGPSHHRKPVEIINSLNISQFVV